MTEKIDDKVAPSSALYLNIEVVNERDGGLVDAYVPVDSIYRTDVPVDDDHVEELAASIESEAAVEGRRGQLSPVLLGEVRGFGQFAIIDGFHRVAAMGDKYGEVYATIRPDCSWEDIVDLRILTANTHRTVRFARVVEWVEDAWQMSPWSDRMTSLQAFSLAKVKQQTGRNLGLNREEAVEIRDWVAHKCVQWKISPHTVHQNLQIARAADPELVKEARERKSGHELKHVTPNHLRIIALGLPQKYDLQNYVANVAKRMKLTVKETEAVVNIVNQHGGDTEQALEEIESGAWLQQLRPKKERFVTVKEFTHGISRNERRIVNQELIEKLIVDELLLAKISLENIVLKGKYVAIPINEPTQAVFEINDDLREYKPVPHDWDEEHIDAVVDRLETISQVVVDNLARSIEGDQFTATQIVNAASRRIVADINSGALKFTGIHDNRILDRLLYGCVEHQLMLTRRNLIDAPKSIPGPIKPTDTVKLGHEALSDSMRYMGSEQRQALILAGFYKLPVFAISQIIGKKLLGTHTLVRDLSQGLDYDKPIGST